MRKDEKEIKTKIIMEGAETYRKELEEIRKAIESAKISADKLAESFRQLNEGMAEFAELRKKLF